MEKNTLLYKIIVGVIVAYQVFTFVVMILWFLHECPQCEKTQQEVNEQYIKQIKEISNAETKSDIDSLLHEFYGFGSK